VLNTSVGFPLFDAFAIADVGSYAAAGGETSGNEVSIMPSSLRDVVGQLSRKISTDTVLSVTLGVGAVYTMHFLLGLQLKLRTADKRAVSWVHLSWECVGLTLAMGHSTMVKAMVSFAGRCPADTERVQAFPSIICESQVGFVAHWLVRCRVKRSYLD